uniref:Uncharacterized protein n=1 Tax=Clytia hemisphaerica TaxID=252671 RepID=A0A7M5X134_9CNID
MRHLKRMKVVDLLRHAQTNFNIKKDVISKNIPINSTGLKQCQESEISKHYEMVVCSPMRRCKETLANIQGITYNQIVHSDLCREHQIANCDFLEHEDENILESEEELLNRVEKFRQFLLTLKEDKILVVSHGDFLWNLTAKKVDDERFGQWLDNCQLYEFELDLD